MTTIPTRYGVVEIVGHQGFDSVLSSGRHRSDCYELTFNGRPYSAIAGAHWDTTLIGAGEWRLEHAFRHDANRRPGRRRDVVKVLVGQSYKAWHAIDEAIREHRKAEGYAQRPKEISACRS
jgi:hypothetical protein